MTASQFSSVLLFPDSSVNQNYQYKFVINGTRWITSSAYPTVKEGKNENNLLRLTSQPATLVPAGIFETLEVPRAYLNTLHQKMALEGFSEMYVSMESEDVMVIVRQNPVTMESYFLIARNWFKAVAGPEALRPFKLPGVVDQVELVAQLNVKDWKFIEDKHEVNGLKGALEVYGSLAKFASVNYV